MTRLRLATDTERVVVGYDPDLATYYVETGPHPPAADVEEDADEGLAAVRGRHPSDLPTMAALLADLHRRGIALTPNQQTAIARANSSPQRPPPRGLKDRDDRPAGTRANTRTWLPSSVVNEAFAPVEGAPVLAVVKQTALDAGCGSARGVGVGNGTKNGKRRVAAG